MKENDTMKPIYTAENTLPAYQLNWAVSLFWREDTVDEGEWLAPLREATESDDVRILEHKLTKSNVSQFLVSTKPGVQPDKIVWSVKGRLQHTIRKSRPKAFRRNYAYRSIGSMTRAEVEKYIEGQMDHHPMADPRVQKRLRQYQKSYDTDLSEARASSHGRYWYNLHLSLVTDWREKELRDDVLTRWGETIEKAADKHDHRLSRVGIVPDHLHLSMSCPQSESPAEVALSYMNNLAHNTGMQEVFKYSYYVGTIGEYNLSVFE